MNNLFDLLNTRLYHYKDGSSEISPKMLSEQFEIPVSDELTKYQQWLQNDIKISGKSKCSQLLIGSINSVLQFWDEYHNKLKRIDYLETRHLSQDMLELFFARQRRSEKNTSVFSFLRNTSKFCFVEQKTKIEGTNVENIGEDDNRDDPSTPLEYQVQSVPEDLSGADYWTYTEERDADEHTFTLLDGNNFPENSISDEDISDDEDLDVNENVIDLKSLDVFNAAASPNLNMDDDEIFEKVFPPEKFSKILQDTLKYVDEMGTSCNTFATNFFSGWVLLRIIQSTDCTKCKTYVESGEIDPNVEKLLQLKDRSTTPGETLLTRSNSEFSKFVAISCKFLTEYCSEIFWRQKVFTLFRIGVKKIMRRVNSNWFMQDNPCSKHHEIALLKIFKAQERNCTRSEMEKFLRLAAQTQKKKTDSSYNPSASKTAPSSKKIKFTNVRLPNLEIKSDNPAAKKILRSLDMDI